jgi:hypothetical protein
MSFPLHFLRSGGRVEPGPGAGGEQLHLGVGKVPVIASALRSRLAGTMATPWACRPPPWTWAPWTHTRGWCGCPAGGRPPRLPSGPSPGSGQGGVVVPCQPVRALVDAAGPLLGCLGGCRTRAVAWATLARRSKTTASGRTRSGGRAPSRAAIRPAGGVQRWLRGVRGDARRSDASWPRCRSRPSSTSADPRRGSGRGTASGIPRSSAGPPGPPRW